MLESRDNAGRTSARNRRCVGRGCFHWNSERQSSQHPFGTIPVAAATYDPRHRSRRTLLTAPKRAEWLHRARKCSKGSDRVALGMNWVSKISLILRVKMAEL